MLCSVEVQNFIENYGFCVDSVDLEFLSIVDFEEVKVVVEDVVVEKIEWEEVCLF